MKHSHKIALKISLIYIAIGILWIFFSDGISMVLASNQLQLYNIYQHSKGWLFIVLTGIVLYVLIFQRTRKLLLSRDALMKKEEELKRSKEHYQSLYSNNPDAVFELDKLGRIVKLNLEGEKMIGYEQSDIKGLKVSGFIIAEEMEASRKAYQEVLSGKPQKFEVTILNRTNEKLILRCSLLPIVVREEVRGVFGIARDITEFRKNEELMIVSEKMSVIGQLAAAVAHEIRNPLTSLKGFVQLMHMTKEVDENHLDIMMSEIDRINLISGEMLILGKKQEVHFQKENLSEVLRQVIVLLEAQAHLDDVSLHYKKEYSENAFVFCDANQLKQVFLNLIKNGIEAIEKNGVITIGLRFEENNAVIELQDNGTGIESELMEMLGEPFYSTKDKGTGLGLAVCFTIIARHKGTIHFDSEKGKGTKVTIVLPLA
ncbi:ATP-binding protein [Metabacillus sp. RGM 3146]|uniref:ATP-binding protein n=1 Tax=Metabacillus sp. RGM 3146 TaxID=3401092 RepID=UPI003B9D2D56